MLLSGTRLTVSVLSKPHKCKWISTLYLPLSILSTAILCYETWLLGIVVSDHVRIVLTWAEGVVKFHLSLISGIFMHPFTFSITQDFQAESLKESDFPGHHSSIKITRLFPFFSSNSKTRCFDQYTNSYFHSLYMKEKLMQSMHRYSSEILIIWKLWLFSTLKVLQVPWVGSGHYFTQWMLVQI